jgi:hypothetical protein
MGAEELHILSHDGDVAPQRFELMFAQRLFVDFYTACSHRKDGRSIVRWWFFRCRCDQAAQNRTRLEVKGEAFDEDVVIAVIGEGHILEGQ